MNQALMVFCGSFCSAVGILPFHMKLKYIFIIHSL